MSWAIHTSTIKTHRISLATNRHAQRFGLSVWFLFIASSFSLAQQPRLKELPVIEKPRERGTERIYVRTRPVQSTKGVLAVAVNPYLNAEVIVKDASGVERARGKADKETGQIEFQLPRKKSYQVEVTFPGYLSEKRQKKLSDTTAVVQVNLIPQFAAIRLRDLPPNAQVLLDGQARAVSDQSGNVALNNIPPGDHQLLVKHAEYNDYHDKFEKLEAGAIATLAIRMAKVAKLTIQSLPNATVYVDGAVQGRINADGQVNLDYELPQAGEHVVSVELIGFQTWTQKLLFTPGPRVVAASLTPIVTSAGMSDSFDSLSLWAHPTTWKLAKDGANSRLQVGSDALGLLKDKLYRNFEVHFTVWLTDGKGASWAVRADIEGKRYYLFHLTGAAPAEGLTPRRFYTYLMQDGVLLEVNSPVTVLTKMNNKDNYTIHLTVKENVITHDMTSNVDGEQNDLGIYTDTTATKERSLYGTFGFRSFKGESFHVDDFNLQPLP